MSIAEKLTTIAENEQKVYLSGCGKGRLDAWNKITNNNKRGYYTYAYRNMPDGSFDPPFAVKPQNSAEGMFHGSGIKKITTEQLDTSECGYFPYIFQNSSIEELGVIDLSKNANNTGVFATASLHTIEKLILSDSGSDLKDAFAYAYGLINIEIEGKISKTVIFVSSKLTYKSLASIIDALFDYSGTTETRTLTLNATAKARLSESDIAKATRKGWSIS